MLFQPTNRQLEEVQSAIPAEPAADEAELDVEAAPIEAEPEAVEAPVVEEEEEKPIVAKLKAQVAALNKKVDAQEREKLAQSYSELFDDIKIAQAKFDEVVSSKESERMTSSYKLPPAPCKTQILDFSLCFLVVCFIVFLQTWNYRNIKRSN